MTRALVWLRRDLRLRDNAALARACASADQVIPVFIHAPEEEAAWSPGAASRWWLHHSLAALDAALRAAGSRLVIRSGPSLATLQTLIRETGATVVYFNRLYEPASLARDRAIEETLRAQGVETESFSGALLFEPWSLRTGSGTPFQVFTPFWNAGQRRPPPQPPLGKPRNLRPPARLPKSHELNAVGLLPTLSWADGFAPHWRPGEAGALARLKRFCADGLADYPRTRDLPAVDGVSRLSPHLHFGELTPRQVWYAVQTAADTRRSSGLARAAAAYLRQIGWREFAFHVLHHWCDTPEQPLRPAFAQFPWRKNYAELLQAWQRGQTGYPLIDAGMRELWASGWMHNRVRMVVASFLVKNLRIPWQEGARWFSDTLVDADLANNTLGWQWAAGCGADAAPYFRIFNPRLQGEKFDPDGVYVRRWLPELARVPRRYVHAPWTMPAAVQDDCGCMIERDYPAPVVDFATSRREALAAYGELKSKR
jgi:deoxyribodipyrimidine photo-lyase